MNINLNLQKNNFSQLISLGIPILAVGLYLSLYRSIYPNIKSKKTIKKSPSYSKAIYFEMSLEDKDQETNPQIAWVSLGIEQPLVIAMVGLPARGKSYLVKMITRYLKWSGIESKVFNVGSYRRKIGHASAGANFFDSNNENFKKMREEMAMKVQEEMYDWLHENLGIVRKVAIFDATNTTRNRRYALIQRAKKENVSLLFVESICDDPKVLEKNYAMKLKNDDYKDMSPEQALKDFLTRVKEYEKIYETIEDDEDDSEICYIKIINVGQKIITRNCHGYLPSQVAFYLQNVHIYPRKIYLSIIAEALEQSKGSENIAGAESGVLSEQGFKYSKDLANFIKFEQENELEGKGKEVLVFTGTSNIHYQSVQGLKDHGFNCYHTSLLNELRGGDFHGLTKAEMKQIYPEEWEKRMADKLNYRYPGVGGESYLDVIERIRPIIIELERQKRSIVIICHLAVLRCIYAYFMGVPLKELPFREFSTHCVYELSPGAYGCACALIDPMEVSDDQNQF